MMGLRIKKVGGLVGRLSPSFYLQYKSKIKVMTVKELISELEKFDGNLEILFHSYIESGRGGSWIEVEDFDIEEHDELENTLKFSISGEEDEDGGWD